jgi:magnesium transporter
VSAVTRVARDELQSLYLARHPLEAARGIESLEIAEAREVLAGAEPRSGARILERLTEDRATRILAGLTPEQGARLLASADPSHAASLLAQLDPEEGASLRRALPPEVAAELAELMRYPEESAGTLMDPRPLALHPETTASEALGRLRERKDVPIHVVFVVDPELKTLTGVVPLRDVATADPDTRLSALAIPPPAAAQAFSSREEVVELLTDVRLPALPVIDVNGRLVGVIRHAALLEAAQEEATVDLQTMMGASREERALSPVSFAVRKRLPWLQVNLGTAFLAASVVSLFEETIARNTALAVLLPVVAGQSGNTGSQALAVVIRALALREVRVRQWLRICVKEANVGLINGVAVAVVCAVATFLWSHSAGLAFVIGASMIISMTIAGLAGAAVPMVLSALGQDPAQSSSIVLTTVTDVVGFFSFLGIATVLSSML